MRRVKTIFPIKWMIIVHTHSYCLFIIEYLLCIKITTKQFWQTHGFKRLKNDFQYIFCDKDEVNFVYNYICGRFSVAKLSMFYKIAVWFVYVDIYHETFYKLYVYILYNIRTSTSNFTYGEITVFPYLWTDGQRVRQTDRQTDRRINPDWAG